MTMNDAEFERLERYVARTHDWVKGGLIGSITIDYLVMRKELIYPALAKLLGVECECRLAECRGCEDVEDWLYDVQDEEFTRLALDSPTDSGSTDSVSDLLL